MSGVARGPDRFGQSSFGNGAIQKGETHLPQSCCVSPGVVTRFGLLESGGEIVGLIEDLLGCAGHR